LEGEENNGNKGTSRERMMIPPKDRNLFGVNNLKRCSSDFGVDYVANEIGTIEQSIVIKEPPQKDLMKELEEYNKSQEIPKNIEKNNTSSPSPYIKSSKLSSNFLTETDVNQSMLQIFEQQVKIQDADLFPKQKLSLILFCFVISILTSMIIGTKYVPSIVGINRCSSMYWLVTFIFFLFLGFCSCYAIRIIEIEHHKKDWLEITHDERDNWTKEK